MTKDELALVTDVRAAVTDSELEDAWNSRERLLHEIARRHELIELAQCELEEVEGNLLLLANDIQAELEATS